MDHVHVFGHVSISLISVAAVIVALLAYGLAREARHLVTQFHEGLTRQRESLRDELNERVAHLEGKLAGASANADQDRRAINHRIDALAKGVGMEFCPRPHYSNPWVVQPRRSTGAWGALDPMGGIAAAGQANPPKEMRTDDECYTPSLRDAWVKR